MDDREQERPDPEAVARVLRRIENRELRQDVDRLTDVVDGHAEHIGELRERSARIESHVEHLIRGQTRLEAAEAGSAEVRRASELAAIEDRKEQGRLKREVWRQVLYKAMAIASGLWALAYACMQARC